MHFFDSISVNVDGKKYQGFQFNKHGIYTFCYVQQVPLVYVLHAVHYTNPPAAGEGLLTGVVSHVIVAIQCTQLIVLNDVLVPRSAVLPVQ